MSNYAAVKLPVNDISSLSKKDKKQTSPNKLNIPNVYEDLDDPSDNNSNDSQARLKQRNRKKNNKKQQNKLKNNSRRDKYGNEIIKGGKKHKIQFSARIQEVRLVENWKMYNCEDYETESEKSSCCKII